MAYTTRVVVRSDDIDVNGHVRDSRYLDYAVHARWTTLAQAGLSVRDLTAARLGPVNLEVTVHYRSELTLGDEVDIATRFEYPAPRIVKVVQSLVRRSDGAEAGQVVSTTGLMDLRERKLVADAAATWSRFLADLTVVDLGVNA